MFSSLNWDDGVTMTTVCELAEPLGLTWYTVVPVSTHELTETVSLELSNSSAIRTIVKRFLITIYDYYLPIVKSPKPARMGWGHTGQCHWTPQYAVSDLVLYYLLSALGLGGLTGTYLS